METTAEIGQLQSAKIEESRAEMTPLQEMNRFLAKCVMDFEKLSKKPESRMEWGTKFYNRMSVRINAVKGFMGDDFDLEQLRDQMLTQTKSDWSKEQLSIAWAGLRSELAIFDVLQELSENGELILVQSDDAGDTALLEQFDVAGGADFVLFRTVDNVVVGIQAKNHKGKEITAFNAADPMSAAALEDEVETLKDMGLMVSYARVKNKQVAFENMVKEMYGKEVRGVLIYVLTGKQTINRRRGEFKVSVVDRARSELLKVINGEVNEVRIKAEVE